MRYFANEAKDILNSQIYIELSNNDIMALTQKINSIIKKDNVLCVVIKRNNSEFYKHKKETCEQTFFNTKLSINNNSNDITIDATIRAPLQLTYLFFASTIFIIALYFVALYLFTLVQKTNIAKTNELNSLARQLAHDIRSPLAALDMAMDSLYVANDSQTKAIIKNATNRINDIANNLLNRSRPKQTTSNSSNAMADHVLILDVVNSIVAEKRIITRNKENISLSLESSSDSCTSFVKVNESTLKRCFSNILNNSIEALGEIGTVSIKIERTINNVSIIIKDNGKGMPKNVLEKLGKKGFSSGKETGNGLGVYHAIQSIESFGGNVVFESMLGIGTTVTISLPIAPSPIWFAEKLTIQTTDSIVIIDDDTCIHDMWYERISNINPAIKNSIIHLYSPDQFSTWLQQSDNFEISLFLINDEFTGISGTGIDLIKKYNLQSKAILVTSKYEDSDIINDVISLGIRMIPKHMIASISIENESTTSIIQYVLIDDDELVRMTWGISATNSNIKIDCYPDYETFSLKKHQYNLITAAIYIDSNLANNINGEDIAKTLFNDGFKNIYLATGYEKDRFKDLTFLSGVQGKTPPWT